MFTFLGGNMSDIKTLYKKHCKKQNRDYFNNYNEMVEVLCLNPKSARKTNIKMVESVCKIDKIGQKIYLKDFVKPKEYKRAINKNEIKKYSYPKLISEYFLILNKNPDMCTAYDGHYFYFTKSELRNELGLLSNKYTSKAFMNNMIEVGNYINSRLTANEFKIYFNTIEEYLAEIKSMANNTIKTAIFNSSIFRAEKIYILFDESWNKTYIKEKKEINTIELAKNVAFSSVCAESTKNIKRPNDLVFFKEESQKYHELVLKKIHNMGYPNAERFEMGYQIAINNKEPELHLSIDEVKKCLSEKFHQTMITHLYNIRKHFCLVSEDEEINALATIKAENKKNNRFDLSKSRRKIETSVKFASNDSIISLALINFLQLHEKNEMKMFSQELEEYVVKDADATASNKELTKRIKHLKNNIQFIEDEILQTNKFIDKNKKIDEVIDKHNYFDILDSLDD